MHKLVSIVEGLGEVHGLRLLMRRILAEREWWEFNPSRPKNAHGCNNLLKQGGVEKFVRLAEKEPGCAAILILIDADSNCARDLAMTLAVRVQQAGSKFPVAIVCAKCEYEAWFLASLPSIAGPSGLLIGKEFNGDVEEVRDVKRWKNSSMQFTPIK